MKYISIAVVALMSQASAINQRGAPTISGITGTNTGPTPSITIEHPRKMPDMSVLYPPRPKLPGPEDPECSLWW